MSQEQQHITPLVAAYAKAILELATAQNQAREINEELEAIAGIIDANDAFANFLANPAVGEAERQQLLEKVFRNRVSPLVMNYLLLVNRKGRMGMLRQISAAYAELLEQQMGIVEVDVFVASRLSSEELEQVRQKVGAALKREAVIHQYLDETIIGGLVLRVEDRLLDASVRARLRAVRQQLLAARRK